MMISLQANRNGASTQTRTGDLYHVKSQALNRLYHLISNAYATFSLFLRGRKTSITDKHKYIGNNNLAKSNYCIRLHQKASFLLANSISVSLRVACYIKLLRQQSTQIVFNKIHFGSNSIFHQPSLHNKEESYE